MRDNVTLNIVSWRMFYVLLRDILFFYSRKKTELKLSTECGILLDRSWLLQSYAVLKIYVL